MNTTVYLLLYHLTFVLHATCASFVFGASVWLTVDGALGLWRPAAADSVRARIAAAMRDLLPFVLGLAITFGIGPLLFVQLLDGRGFYTAGILLSHRFMAILPALIVGFYLLYVQKTDWRFATSQAGRLLVPAVAMLCFAYTAWHWTEQHLLAQRPEVWPDVYAAGPLAVQAKGIPARLLAFCGVAALTTAWLVGWRIDVAGRARLRLLAAGGIAMLWSGVVLHAALAEVPDGVEPGALAGTVGTLGIATAVVAAAWAAGAGSRHAGVVLGVATLLVVERVSELRLAWRAAVSGAPVVEDPSTAGSPLFVVCLVGVAMAIGWAVVAVRRDLARRAAA